ncbi:unnamed protein product [Vitrella brassicaformis CCMP3155]|uniref:non-specific serine/threonine protein kinase n=2 Tax=Vitrella brassicaformis TaxID=1169539 RepID=A0A0G4EP76_VITBC|nr:unnamed protein product [Vitrella brassicaformis CCMP3155]|eukprot:CEL99612.1 unnamed protein product [Vitrella brassicaformis CCMP3155]
MRGYTKVRDVGKGSFGQAILVADADGKQFIMKIIDISRMGSKERKEAINEVKVLSSLKHPYIISYRESFIENGQLCIVMDYAEGGDLYHKIQKQKKTSQYFSESQILRWFTQAALSLKYMHDKHILHRDIKTQNFFLTASGRLRVGDFGISKVLESTMAFAQTTIGTPYYLSPEICKEQPYSWASDIWALGCVLYEMACLRVPFDAQNLRSLVDKITRGPTPTLPSSYSAGLRQLLADCLQRDPRKRPSAAELLQKDIIQGEIRRMLKEEQLKKGQQGGGHNGGDSKTESAGVSTADTTQRQNSSEATEGPRADDNNKQQVERQPSGGGSRHDTPNRDRRHPSALPLPVPAVNYGGAAGGAAGVRPAGVRSRDASPVAGVPYHRQATPPGMRPRAVRDMSPYGYRNPSSYYSPRSQYQTPNAAAGKAHGVPRYPAAGK